MVFSCWTIGVVWLEGASGGLWSNLLLGGSDQVAQGLIWLGLENVGRQRLHNCNSLFVPFVFIQKPSCLLLLCINPVSPTTRTWEWDQTHWRKASAFSAGSSEF